jgi:hypothetical protein
MQRGYFFGIKRSLPRLDTAIKAEARNQSKRRKES